MRFSKIFWTDRVTNLEILPRMAKNSEIVLDTRKENDFFLKLLINYKLLKI